MTLFNELDLLDEAEREARQVAETMHFDSDVDRRKFVFFSLAAAAATTFGFGSKALSQTAGAPPGGAAPAGGGGRAQQPQVPPVPLDNMEEMSWTFQPYPGGTGVLLEKTYREKGMAAFNRQAFAWNSATPGAFNLNPWGTAALPATDDEIAFLPAYKLGAAIKAGKLTSTRLTKIYLDRLKKYNGTLLCAVTILEDTALADAAKMDAEIKAGKYRGPLHGIPWGVKDLFAVKGTPTTWGAADFENRVIDDDSEVVVRLRNAGAVLIAKLSTGQFAQGGNWFRGSTKNPWNTTQGSSGSSAGPASATAAGCVAFGIGTETDGSIVSPTTTCGLSALRPTFGRVSRYGGMVLSWSQDRVGPITRNLEDAAMVFNVIHGGDPKDPSTITMPFHFNANI
ncbi:MAG: amidase, partial [Gemmatimonadaceae bacterium]